jgi:hypothetical protein
VIFEYAFVIIGNDKRKQIIIVIIEQKAILNNGFPILSGKK